MNPGTPTKIFSKHQMRFFLAILLFAAGFVLMKYSYNIYQYFGPLDFAEKYLGGAGTNTFYKLFGLLLIVAGFLKLFGIF